jgi:hypothetical protein
VTVDTVDTLARDRAIRYQRLTRAFEWPMAILALAVIPALLLDNGAATHARDRLRRELDHLAGILRRVWGAVCPRTGPSAVRPTIVVRSPHHRRLAAVWRAGVFTATIASLFMIQDEEDEFNGIHKRLDDLEAKLDHILDRGRHGTQEGHGGALHH